MGDTPRGLIALICAYRELEDAAGLRATLPIAGRTLLERQGRIAASLGAEALLIVTDPKASGVTTTVERLRNEGLQVLLARDVGEAARALESTDRVLLIGDGALVEEEEAVRVTDGDGEGYALLTVPDAGHDERYERIDAESRWAGIAMIDGRLVRHTAPMLQDWDLQSTLLRRAVQDGARQIRVRAEADPIMADSPEDLKALEDDIMQGVAGAQRDWVSRYLLSPVEAQATRRLIGGKVNALHLLAGGLATQALSAASFLSGWFWPGLILYLLSTPLTGTGERIGRLTGLGRVETMLRRLIPGTAAASLLALGLAASHYDGWGAMVLAATALAFAAATEGEHPRRTGGGLFLAEHKGMGWLMLPFAAAGQWTLGIGALLGYAGASFFTAQRQVHGRTRRHED